MGLYHFKLYKFEFKEIVYFVQLLEYLFYRRLYQTKLNHMLRITLFISDKDKWSHSFLLLV